MSWTDERVETLKKMWNEGLSASQIAKELGGVTRNAVIGKVHRLGLSNRSAGEETTAAPAAPDVTPEPPRAASAPPPRPAAAAPQARPAAPARPVRPAPAAMDDDLSDIDAVDADDDQDDIAARDDDNDADDLDEIPGAAIRRAIVPAGQPLPPQPSANEISAEALAKVSEVEKVARKLTLMELTEKTCKWPVGDPSTPHFWFCGLPVQSGKPYCEAHVGVAFQPMNTRRDRRR
ncbi:GcrA family cell cycle regulator [Ketogulonicigenium vulgare]|uniref:GcrA family cell cycle regulator n=1 Tax=Ketogulonicigenium vulgare TaxID=92945 RepID=UPI002359A3B5|nr:GcrA family cell cycle regulator [Ketogulonicigenium vulgare]